MPPFMCEKKWDGQEQNYCAANRIIRAYWTGTRIVVQARRKAVPRLLCPLLIVPARVCLPPRFRVQIKRTVRTQCMNRVLQGAVLVK